MSTAIMSASTRRTGATTSTCRRRLRRPSASFLPVAAAAASISSRSSVSAYQQDRPARVTSSSAAVPTSTGASSTSTDAVPSTPSLLPPGISPRETYHAPHIRRVLCVSDLHTDYDTNLRWAKEQVESDADALLLVAGDVSHDLDVVRRTLAALRSKFGEVAYVPGNHDLWVTGKGKDGAVVEGEDGTPSKKIETSVDKLVHLLTLCDEEDVRTGPVRAGRRGTSGEGVWAVPLLSWHHKSFDTEPDIDPECWGGIPSIERCMADYRRSKWPEPLSATDDSVAEFVDGLNDALFPGMDEKDGLGLGGGPVVVGADGSPVLTFSHFLPRIELTPEKRYLLVPTLNKAVGSTYLERRLRKLGSSLHVFGHTHFGWDQSVDGVRYVQAALAYPRERERRARSLRIGSMAPGEGEERLHPVCVWDADSVIEGSEDNKGTGDGAGSQGGFPNEWLGGYWSDRYAHVPRTPEVTTALAPWVAGRYRQLPGGKVEAFERHVSTREPSLR